MVALVEELHEERHVALGLDAEAPRLLDEDEALVVIGREDRAAKQLLNVGGTCVPFHREMHDTPDHG